MEFVNFLEPTEFSTVWWSKPHGMLYYIYRLCGSITQIRSYLWHDSIRQLLRKWPKSSRELLSNKSRGQLQPQTSLIDIIIDTTCWLWSLLLILLVFISRTWLFCTISNMRGGTFFDRPFRNRVLLYKIVGLKSEFPMQKCSWNYLTYGWFFERILQSKRQTFYGPLSISSFRFWIIWL